VLRKLLPNLSYYFVFTINSEYEGLCYFLYNNEKIQLFCKIIYKVLFLYNKKGHLEYEMSFLNII